MKVGLNVCTDQGVVDLILTYADGSNNTVSMRPRDARWLADTLHEVAAIAALAKQIAK